MILLLLLACLLPLHHFIAFSNDISTGSLNLLLSLILSDLGAIVDSFLTASSNAFAVNHQHEVSKSPYYSACGSIFVRRLLLLRVSFHWALRHALGEISPAELNATVHIALGAASDTIHH